MPGRKASRLPIMMPVSTHSSKWTPHIRHPPITSSACISRYHILSNNSRSHVRCQGTASTKMSMQVNCLDVAHPVVTPRHLAPNTLPGGVLPCHNPIHLPVDGITRSHMPRAVNTSGDSHSQSNRHTQLASRDLPRS